MDPIDNPVPSTPAPAPSDDLQAQVDRLHQVVHSILIMAIVVSGTLGVYLFYQMRSAQKELQQVDAAYSQYEKNAKPAIDEFARRLALFGRTHPDFQPISAKYGLEQSLTNMGGAKAPAPVPVKPAPVPTPAKK